MFIQKMWASALWIVCMSLVFGTSLSCFDCFIDWHTSGPLCRDYFSTKKKVVSIDDCFTTIRTIFNSDSVLKAGRVDRGYDIQLNEFLNAQIRDLVKELGGKRNTETVYEEKLQKVADNFIAAASKLPRGAECVPPCGFQNASKYNCIRCQYDSCEFPLDCPVKEIQVMEHSRTRMWCNVSFDLPNDIEIIWRFAEKVNTQQVDQFKEVTAGVDSLYSIPSVNSQHQGTYQCEIYSEQRSIVRLYYYLSVTPQVVVGHTELQEIFDLSLLPGGSLLPAPPSSLHRVPPPQLLISCLTALLLLLFLSLGTLYWSSIPEERGDAESADDEDLGSWESGRHM